MGLCFGLVVKIGAEPDTVITMHLLFEEFHYPSKKLDQLGLDGYYETIGSNEAKFNYVGYFRNLQKDAIVFTLPKIFLKDGKLFGKHAVGSFIEGDARSRLGPIEYASIKDLAEGIYFALRKYQRERESGSVSREYGPAIKTNIGSHDTTSFEAMLSIIAFNKEHPFLYTHKRQIQESRNPKRVNWKKTMVQVMPVLYQGFPHFLEWVGYTPSQKQVDPLLIIYYSILANFRQYDPTIVIDSNIPILPTVRLAKLRPRIMSFLKISRSSYFSDSLRRVHNLLLPYYLREQASYADTDIEFLFMDNFESVFERIVDSVISDQDLLRVYKHLKDGKEIDHLFGEKDVFMGHKIIYIGDSKYYKDPSSVSTQKHKQFTYARNIIQENIYIMNSGKATVYSLNYRDAISEGYNVTPNFFILGTVNADYREGPELIKPMPKEPEFSNHFPNRLFDRDTLHVLYFQADFIRFLNLYVGRHKRLSFGKLLARGDVHSLIQRHLIQYLNNKYEFFRLSITREQIEDCFRLLLGKIFTSPPISPQYILALEKSFPDENSNILQVLAERKVPYTTFELTATDHL